MRATSQQGPFVHCKACQAPFKSRPLRNREGVSPDSPKYKEYYGAWEEVCPSCREKTRMSYQHTYLENQDFFSESTYEDYLNAC